MAAWAIRGVELPFGDRHDRWWVDEHGVVGQVRIDDAEELPGSYFFSGLVDAHAHPAVASGPAGPVPLDAGRTSATLLAWAQSGVTLVRDVGSPGGMTLDLSVSARHPQLLAAGRFLAPQDRYFSELLVEPVEEEGLVAAALAELRRGATWVKVIGDFPRVPHFTDHAPTYSARVVAELVRAVHAVGGRVAVHSTLPSVADFVAAGVDSVEHGPALDYATLDEMAARGTGWTPTCCALFALAADPDLPPQRRQMLETAKERMAELLPYAVARGVPVLAGTDVAGSMAREVALLSGLGLEPAQALAAASDTARKFLGFEFSSPNIVTYARDPRDDPGLLNIPSAVVVNGIRVR
jgi:imidazolonepropionase-like amidohydrolase